MPNEGPYGGRIEIREDGSVIWQAAPREFPRHQDTEGKLDYAIRVINKERAIFGSTDGKCILNVHPNDVQTCIGKDDDRNPMASETTSLAASGQLCEAFEPAIDPTNEIRASSIPSSPCQIHNDVQTGAKSAVLIVSGYEEPDEMADSVVVGKSYFVTGASLDQDGPHEHTMPPYDVHLHYDEYDLDRVGTISEQAIEESKLSFCYQHWVSVRSVWRYYRYMRFMLLKLNSDRVIELSNSPEWEGRQLSEDDVKSLISWSRTYCHLCKLGIPRKTLDAMVVPLGDWEDEIPDMWLSIWKQIRDELPRFPTNTPEFVHRKSFRPGKRIGDELPHEPTSIPEFVSRAPVRPGKPIGDESRQVLTSIPEFVGKASVRRKTDQNATSASANRTEIPKKELGQLTKTVVDFVGKPIITKNDLLARWPADDPTRETFVSGIFVTGHRVNDIVGSRTVIVQGITRPGTFALMYHWKLDVDHQHEHCTEFCGEEETSNGSFAQFVGTIS